MQKRKTLKCIQHLRDFTFECCHTTQLSAAVLRNALFETVSFASKNFNSISSQNLLHCQQKAQYYFLTILPNSDMAHYCIAFTGHTTDVLT